MDTSGETTKHHIKYYENRFGRGPTRLLVTALANQAHSLINQDLPALDLGCGTGDDAKYLKEHGFKVTAVDSEPAAAGYLKRFGLEFVQADFSKFQYPRDYYALVNSQFALPFAEAKDLTVIIEKIKLSLRSGGVFVANFFGHLDDWARQLNPEIIFLNKIDVKKLLMGFDILEIQENIYQGSDASKRLKQWHLINVIAQKNKS